MFNESNLDAHPRVLENKRKGEAIMKGLMEPENRNEKQLNLAWQVYRRKHFLEEDSPVDEVNAMLFWTEENINERTGKKEDSLSATYRKIEDDPEFKEHPRLLGNFKNITLEDILEYRKTGVLS